MSGLIPSFLSGARCVIKINGETIAYAQSLSINDDVGLTPVGGIGSFNFHTNEPTSYLVRGSMQITNYSDKTKDLNTGINKVDVDGKEVSSSDGKFLPAGGAKIDTKSTSSKGRDGNSMLSVNFFSPAALILSTTAQIVVYERIPNGMKTDGSGYTTTDSDPLYTIDGVRFNSYNISFNVGSLVMENVSFMATSMIDHRAEKTSNTTKIG
jgi:hypothetical protein